MKIRHHGITKMHYTKTLPCPVCGAQPEFGWFQRPMGFGRYVQLAVIRCPKHHMIHSAIVDQRQRNDITRKALIRNWNGMANDAVATPFRRKFAKPKKQLVAMLAR
jgi:hypothetical protein